MSDFISMHGGIHWMIFVYLWMAFIIGGMVYQRREQAGFLFNQMGNKVKSLGTRYLTPAIDRFENTYMYRDIVEWEFENIHYGELEQYKDALVGAFAKAHAIPPKDIDLHMEQLKTNHFRVSYVFPRVYKYTEGDMCKFDCPDNIYPESDQIIFPYQYTSDKHSAYMLRLNTLYQFNLSKIRGLDVLLGFTKQCHHCKKYCPRKQMKLWQHGWFGTYYDWYCKDCEFWAKIN